MQKQSNPEIHDSELEECVRELLHNSHEDYSQVEVSVEAGEVHFLGHIHNDAARKHLEEMAFMVQGIGSVVNEATVKH